MLFGKPNVPGPLGHANFLVFLMVENQTQSFQMLIPTIKSQNVVINMVWGTRGAGTFGICNSPCMSNGKQTNSNIPNDNPNHQVAKSNN